MHVLIIITVEACTAHHHNIPLHMYTYIAIDTDRHRNVYQCLACRALIYRYRHR